MKLQGRKTRACLLTDLLTRLLTYSLTLLLASMIWATRSLPDMGMKMYSQQAVYGHEQHSPWTQMQTLSDTDKEAVNGSCRRETALQRGSVFGG